MKILTVLLALLFLMTGIASPVFAGELSISETVKKIPALKQGIAYSIADSEFCYLSTLEILNKFGVSLEVGYSSKDKAVAVVSYKLLELKDYVNVPVLDLLEANIGAYYGFGRLNLGIGDRGSMDGNNESDYGLSLTLLDIKF